MFKNILKWSFSVLVGEVEKEFHLHLDSDTPLEAIEEVARQMIVHCDKVREFVKQQQSSENNQQEAQKALDKPVEENLPVTDEVKECPVQN